jgi:AbrB family transcriptional regulator (stage V sporulation protein T)
LILRAFSGVEKFFSFYLTRSDELGRVVVPKEIRRTLRIREGDPLEIFTDREGEIILKKYSPIGELGNFAQQYAETLAQTSGHTVCITDRDQVIAVAGGSKKEYLGKNISKELEHLIQQRMPLMARAEDKKFIPLLAEGVKQYLSEIISPILCQGDSIGAVALLGNSAGTRMGDVEQALATSAAGFLGRQMEN